jgi:hypothetical protein
MRPRRYSSVRRHPVAMPVGAGKFQPRSSGPPARGCLRHAAITARALRFLGENSIAGHQPTTPRVRPT